jgi:hypothetical protein
MAEVPRDNPVISANSLTKKTTLRVLQLLAKDVDEEIRAFAQNRVDNEEYR